MTANQLLASLQHLVTQYPEVGDRSVIVDIQLGSRTWKQRQLGISSSVKDREGIAMVCLACPIYSSPEGVRQ